MNNAYPKLIRDNIPEIIKANSGRVAATQTLTNDDVFLKYLLLKVVEEANEVAATTDDRSLVEELADVEEVIDAILTLKNISRTDVQNVQAAKRKKRGGFVKRLLMLHND